jgi:hypothetical protein
VARALPGAKSGSHSPSGGPYGRTGVHFAASFAERGQLKLIFGRRFVLVNANL